MAFKIGKIVIGKRVESINQTEHEGKMKFVPSISTSCRRNKFCLARMKEKLNVCVECFANALIGIRKELDAALVKNADVLTDHLFTDEEAATVKIKFTKKMLEGNPKKRTRIESFGDVSCLTQARNYIRIIRANPDCNFAIWSKNWFIWAVAFEMDGKPENCTYVHSSLQTNVPDEVPERIAPWVDHVFTVYEGEYAATNGIETNCAAESCARCGRCYEKNQKDFWVNEKLRRKGGAKKVAQKKAA